MKMITFSSKVAHKTDFQEINPEAEVQLARQEEPEEEVECPNHEPP